MSNRRERALTGNSHIMEVSVRAALRQQAHQANIHTSQNKQEMAQDFRNIYSTLTCGLSSEETKLAVMPPPPELMTLLVRNMIYPDILSAFIPDLLEVLSNVEKWRKIANARACHALMCDEYWPHYDKPYPSGLTNSDRKVLQVISNAQEVTRTKYIEILKQYCNLHLYNIWTSQSPVDAEHFTQVFQSYFASDTTELYLSLRDLTPTEKTQFTEVKKGWVEFITECAKNGYSVQPNVQTTNQEQLAARTEAYLVLVQKQIDSLERIFDEDAYKYRVCGVSCY
ncbi:hypothetical protein DFJ43DRAFT_1045404 [Lentinula guzmanii]|uniref:Uncharacterized protein n=1 Tax=Lentinula guzmanii TaxID=2804957 RepID=A0AA38N5S2_9AGAR|nr:hypothetical protein DFJ43DRAFT_1045404 [Lentinula guzmanii]